MLLRDIRQLFRSELKVLYSVNESDQLFYMLLAHYHGFPKFILGLEPDKNLLKEEEAPLFRALDRLKHHEPVQYIIGKAYFMDMELAVGPGVLIPRPETEELVRWIVEEFSCPLSSCRILDVGTGSGCIAIALVSAWPHATVCGMDRSEDALAFARRNGSLQKVDVQWKLRDMRHAEFDDRFELIVSNPPYVPLSEAAGMQLHVRESEPHQALFVPDQDPLLFYKHLLALSRRCLKPGGWLYVETHARFGVEVLKHFRTFGFSEIQLKKDIFGRDRYVRGRFTEPVGSVSK